MKPTLIIDDEKHKVTTLDYQGEMLMYVSIERDGQMEMRWNELVSPWDDTAINLDNAIHWEGRYAPLYAEIDDLIEKYREELNELSTQIIEALIGTEYVPPNLITKYRNLKQELEGVYTTLKLIKEVDAFRNKGRVESNVL